MGYENIPKIDKENLAWPPKNPPEKKWSLGGKILFGLILILTFPYWFSMFITGFLYILFVFAALLGGG